jgi:hypothetical protein
MARQEVINEGAFTADTKKVINDNFTELYLDGTALEKVAVISLGAAQLGGTETNTSFTFPANGAIFLNAWLKVTDAEAGGTVDVGTQGTSNDPDGILDGVSLATLGYVGPVATVGLTNKFITGGDPLSVTSSGDLNSCSATLYVRYFELPAV